MTKTSAAERAAAAARKDKAKRACYTESESASSDDDKLLKKRDRQKKLQRDLQEHEKEAQRIQSLIDEATLKSKEKLKELAAVRNSYPVIVRILFCFSCLVD